MMSETLLYLVSSLWLGAAHAATPGHGKTIAAAYIVGARGRPAAALILGIFVTLSHTSGIVLVAVLASLGLPGLVPQHVEAYLSLCTGILIVVIGVWLLLGQRVMLSTDSTTPAHCLDPDHSHNPPQAHEHGDEGDYEPWHGTDNQQRQHEDEPGYHSHGWGVRHTHRVDVASQDGPKLMILLGLGIAGGFLPDPAALAIL